MGLGLIDADGTVIKVGLCDGIKVNKGTSVIYVLGGLDGCTEFELL